jgi:hypothetical protein
MSSLAADKHACPRPLPAATQVRSPDSHQVSNVRLVKETGTSADVVVVGYGPAGASAAIAAHDAGRGVIVVEAGDRGGGNARYSGGFLFDVPGEKAVDHLDALCFGRTSRAVLGAYVDGLHGLDGWLRSLGGVTARFDPPPGRLPASFPSWPHFPGGATIGYRTVAGAGRPGEALWEVLDSAVRARGIPVRFGTAASELIRSPDGAVAGLSAVHAGEPVRLMSPGGVVLACGGFEADEVLAEAYLPLVSSWPVGHPGNTGAGLVMAQQAGAALWHMYGYFGWFAFRAPEFESPFAIDFFGASHLFVDADGRRFADETGYEVHDRLRALLWYLPRNHNRPRLPSWAVFDEAARLAGPLNGLLGTPNDYRWSPDNSAEVERGWIVSAGSPAELAARIAVDPEVLRGTLDGYNASAVAGRDTLFGRSADTLVRLDLSRLYAIETWPGIAGTTGGPKHDELARYCGRTVRLSWGYMRRGRSAWCGDISLSTAAGLPTPWSSAKLLVHMLRGALALRPRPRDGRAGRPACCRGHGWGRSHWRRHRGRVDWRGSHRAFAGSDRGSGGGPGPGGSGPRSGIRCPPAARAVRRSGARRGCFRPR